MSNPNQGREKDIFDSYNIEFKVWEERPGRICVGGWVLKNQGLQNHLVKIRI